MKNKNKNVKVKDGYIYRTCVKCEGITKYTRKTKPLKCPFCNDKYWDKPKDERDLFILQDLFLERGRSKEVLGEMYPLIYRYSNNIIINSVKENLFLHPEIMEERTQELATLLIEKYLRDETFKVEWSFGGFLIRISKGILYNKKVKNNDQNFSLETIVKDKLTIENTPHFFIKDPDSKREYELNYLSQYDKVIDDMLYSELKNLIDIIYSKIVISESRRDSILFLVGLRNFFNDSILMTEYYDFSGNRPRQLVENAKMFIRHYLLERKKD